MKRYLFAFILLACTIPLTCSAKNKDKKKSLSPYQTLEIIEVNSNSIVVQDQRDNAKKTYTLTPTTTIRINGSPAKISDLHSGMLVETTHLTATSAGLVLDDLDVHWYVGTPGGNEKKK